MKQISKQLSKYVHVERKMSPIKHVDFIMFIMAFLKVLSGYAQLFDFYSDIGLLYLIYIHSLDLTNPEYEGDYQIAITICFVALTVSFLAQ